jgi:hypothetical protein
MKNLDDFKEKFKAKLDNMSEQERLAYLNKMGFSVAKNTGAIHQDSVVKKPQFQINIKVLESAVAHVNEYQKKIRAKQDKIYKLTDLVDNYVSSVSEIEQRARSRKSQKQQSSQSRKTNSYTANTDVAVPAKNLDFFHKST